MAEIFGAVASGAGLVSLSMQLLESAQKLKGFYDSARDAPATLEYLYRDLETMSLALHQFERYRQSDIPGNELLQRCIVTCERSVRSITTAVDEVDRLMHRARFAGRIYMGFKEPEVKRLLQEMEHAKSSMSLTYMGYCQSWHMRQTATALALQSQHTERLKDSIESGNATLIGHIANLYHTMTRLANGSSPHQIPMPALDNDLDVLRCESTKRPKARTYRLGLPNWLTDCVWEFAVHSSANVWTVQVYNINIRPRRCYVFDVVSSGDVKAVRELLEFGQLSLRDRAHNPYGPDRTLLEVAAHPANLELCSFLLRESSIMQEETCMQSALTRILGWLQYPRLSSPKDILQFGLYQEAAYGLFVKEYGLSTDLNEHPDFHFPHKAQALSLTGPSFQIILASQLTPFASMTIAQRFSTAMDANGWPADAFLASMLRPNPVETVSLANKEGKTSLHWAAAHFGEWLCRYPCPPSAILEHHGPRERAESYGSLASELVKMGSDLHALWYSPASELGGTHSQENDPFISFLRGLRSASVVLSEPSWARESLLDAVNQWGQMLVAGGRSLTEYIAVENRFLSRTHCIDASYDLDYDTWTFIPTKLEILGDGTLSVQVIDVVDLPVWRSIPIHARDTWPMLTASSSTIIWKPDVQDESDGFQWSEIASFRIVSHPYHVRPLSSLAQSSDLADCASNARQELVFSATQDDHGKLANIITREARLCHRHDRKHSHQRATSLPPFPAETKQSLEPNSLISTEYYSRTGIYQVHKCSSDLRWSSSSRHHGSLRECMQRCHQDHVGLDYQKSFPQGWEYGILCDESLVWVARRFAERFYPAYTYIVDETSEKAAERADLNMRSRRQEDDGVSMQSIERLSERVIAEQRSGEEILRECDYLFRR